MQKFHIKNDSLIIKKFEVEIWPEIKTRIQKNIALRRTVYRLMQALLLDCADNTGLIDIIIEILSTCKNDNEGIYIVGRVQEELARRVGKKKVKEIGAKTEQGKYSSKYALTELLICGECHTPYKRCTWTAHGEKRIVWRCVKRLNYGKKYCHNSPTLEESRIQAAIVNAIQKFAQQDTQLFKNLKSHIERGINDAVREDDSLDIQLRLAAVEKEINELFNTISVDTIESFDEKKAEELLSEKNKLQAESDRIAELNQKDKNKQSRIAEITELLDGIKNRTMEYDDRLVRQIIEAIIVESKEKIKVIFIGGYEMEQVL